MGEREAVNSSGGRQWGRYRTLIYEATASVTVARGNWGGSCYCAHGNRKLVTGSGVVGVG